MPHQSADRTRRQPNRVTRTPDQHPMLPLDLKRAGPLKARAHYGADEPHTYSSRRDRVPLAVAENHQGRVAALLPPRDRTGLTMLTAMAAIFIVLSIGILIAHALDAFRSR
jgi:hypothetical protein